MERSIISCLQPLAETRRNTTKSLTMRVFLVLGLVFLLAPIPPASGGNGTAREIIPDANTALLDHFNGSTVGTAYGPLSYETSLPGLAQAGRFAPGTFIQYAFPAWYTYCCGANATTQGTIEMWVKPEQWGDLLNFNWYSTTSLPPAGHVLYQLGVFDWSGGAFGYATWNGERCCFPSGLYGTTVQPTGEWLHLAISWSPTVSKLYVNGVLEASVPSNVYPAIAPTVNAYLNVWGTGTFTGLIDEFHVSTVQRTDEEILLHATLTKPLVLLADKIILKRTKQDAPEGDMYSNGTLTVEKGDPSIYNSNLTAVGKITILKDNTINGEVTSATEISNSGTINGARTIGPVEVKSLPSLSYSAGGANKNVASGGSLALPPGSYNVVTLKGGGTLKLTSGEYFMNELRYSGSEAVIEIDLTSGDEVTINVVNNLQLGKEVAIQLLPNGESASKLVTFNTRQSTVMSLGKEAYLLGNFNAPNAKVTLEKNSQLRGALSAKEILVERDCLFLPHDSPNSLPGPGNLPKEFVSDNSEIVNNQGLVDGYQLEQNYPNPFNPATEIRFALPEANHVVLKVFNTLGEEIRTLVNAPYEAGYHRVLWDGKDNNDKPLASGVYLYQLRAGAFAQVKKMSLVR